MAGNVNSVDAVKTNVDYSSANITKSREKTSFKKLLFGDNNFVPPQVSIGEALRSYNTAAGRTE